jgi:chromosomal replication initiator protein
LPVSAISDWEKVCDHLAQTVPAESFKTWFGNVEILRFDQEELCLGVPNLFIKNWIEKNYRDLLLAALEQACACRPGLKVTISPSSFRQMRDSQTENDPVASEACPDTQHSPVRKAATGRNQLNPKLILTDFHAGTANFIAYAACLRIIEQPNEYNPLYLFGGHGLGKTHLAQGLCHEAQAKQPGAGVIYLTGEGFVSEFTQAFTNRKTASFRQRLRECKLLVIDDLQVISQGNKAASQEELLNTIDVRLNNGLQTVFASNCAASALPGLTERLKTRLAGGLSVEMKTPDVQARREIVIAKAREKRASFTPEVVELIAQKTYGCVRELEGIVSRLAALANLAGVKVSVEAARDALPEEKIETLPLERIARAVCDEFGVTLTEITGRSRSQTIRNARQTGAFLARKFTGASLAEIGAYFGQRSHSTILAMLKGFPKLAQTERDLLPRTRKVLFLLGKDATDPELLMGQGDLF